MKTAVIGLTKNGSRLAGKIGKALPAHIYINEAFMKEAEEEGVQAITGSLSSLVEKLFGAYDALVFVMACGIVVRTIAPHIKSKLTDPAVVVLDEKGRHAISLLSGHEGGANRLARKVAEISGGTAVITTATDVNQVVAFDAFAAENGLAVENREALKHISSELVNGGKVGFYSDYPVKGSLPENLKVLAARGDVEAYDGRYAVMLTNRTDINTRSSNILVLRPRNLILGIGCRKGTGSRQIREFIEEFMRSSNRSFLSVKCLATIDLKKDEPGLAEFCRETGMELKIIGREAIVGIEKEFTCSDFVKQQVGVASVAEPCAVLASTGGRLVCRKKAYRGITLAMAEEDREYSL